MDFPDSRAGFVSLRDGRTQGPQPYDGMIFALDRTLMMRIL